jgi:hypothetical protein
MADPESIRDAVRARAPFSTWVGVVFLFLLFGVIVLAVVGPAPRGDTFEDTRAKKRADILKTTRETEAKELGSYGWIDKNKGVVRLPVGRAIELTVVELARQKPAPAYPIAAAGPQVSPPAGAAPPSPTVSPAPQPSGTPKATSVAGPSSEARGQPAAAINPPPAPPGSQPGPSAPPPAASPATAKPNPPPGTQPSASPSPTASPARSPATAAQPSPTNTPQTAAAQSSPPVSPSPSPEKSP